MIFVSLFIRQFAQKNNLQKLLKSDRFYTAPVFRMLLDNKKYQIMIVSTMI